MMIHVSQDRLKALEDFAHFMRGSESTVVNCLRTFASNMDESAEQLQSAYDAGVGKDLPAPAEGHVSMAITHQGYKHLAALSRENASAARKAADEIERRLEDLLDIE